MLDFELLKRSFQNVKSFGIKSVLTILGIVVAVALIVALISIGQGFLGSINEQFESFGTNTLIILAGSNPIESAFARLEEEDAERIEKIPQVDMAVDIYTESLEVEYKGEKKMASAIAAESEKFSKLEVSGFLELAEGALTGKQNGVIVGGRFAEDKFEKEIHMGSMIKIEGKELRTIGILKTGRNFASGMFSNALLIDKENLLELRPEAKPMRIFVKFDGAADVEEVKEKITKKLKAAHGQEDFQIMDSKQLIESSASILGTINLVVLGIAAISLIVGAIGVMNLMFMNVSNRTKEIGIMKSTGATNRQVLLIFLTEAMLIGIIGGVIGAIIGVAVGFAAGLIATELGFELTAIASIDIILFAVLFAGLVGIISGVLPARRASKLDPVEAIRKTV